MAGKLPYIQFYPGDWLRDDVSGCSLAAQGLWLRMMIVAHDSARYGYLETNGSPMPPDVIARRCGCDGTAQYETLLSELVTAGVPGKTDNAIIFSRRMVKDGNLRAVRAKAGKKGGKQSAKQKRSKLKANTQQNPEDEVDNDNESANAFELFWSRFPKHRRKARARAEKAWKTALVHTSSAEIISATAEYAASDEGRSEYVRMPSTWLNDRGWSEDPATWIRKGSDPRGTRDAAQQYMDMNNGHD